MQMPYPITVQQQIDAFDWQGLALLMGIPRDQREDFICQLQYPVVRAWQHAREAEEGYYARLAPIEAEIAKTFRAAIRAIEKLGTHAAPADRAMVKAMVAYLNQNVSTAKQLTPRLD